MKLGHLWYLDGENMWKEVKFLIIIHNYKILIFTRWAINITLHNVI